LTLSSSFFKKKKRKKWITTRFDQDLGSNAKLVETLFEFIETEVTKDSELLANNLKNTLLLYVRRPLLFPFSFPFSFFLFPFFSLL